MGMENNEAIIVRVSRWINNAKRNNANMLAELREEEPMSPLTLAHRISDNLAKIEAWEDVLKVLS